MISLQLEAPQCLLLFQANHHMGHALHGAIRGRSKTTCTSFGNVNRVMEFQSEAGKVL